MTFWSGFVLSNLTFYFQFVCTKPPQAFFLVPQNFKKQRFQKPERAELSVFRAQKCFQERFQGKFKSSFCGSQNSYKKIADLYTIQTEKSLKSALERKVFIVVLRGKALKLRKFSDK